jgi:molybdopterin synthase catalytic subunit
MDVLKITNNPLFPWKKLQEFESNFLKNEKGVGASACFVGTMRDFNEGDDVIAMTLEHYPAMTQRQLQHIIDQSYKQWPLLHTMLIHRVGKIFPSEPIVVVAAWSAHREAAFDACRFLMEELKTSAPFWKKEQLLNGDERWVAHNTKAISH